MLRQPRPQAVNLSRHSINRCGETALAIRRHKLCGRIVAVEYLDNPSISEITHRLSPGWHFLQTAWLN